MELEAALKKLGEQEARIKQLEPLETEVVTLRGHKERLEGDLAKVRSAKNAAEEERDSLREKVPKDGSVTLSKADSERWQAYQTLGKPDELRSTLERVGTLEAQEQRRQREATIRSAGYDPKKLERILGDAGFKVTGEGEELKAFVVNGEDEKPLDDWAEAEDITDLLNFARLEPEKQGVRALGQAGRRSTQKALTVEERKKEKESDPLYNV